VLQATTMTTKVLKTNVTSSAQTSGCSTCCFLCNYQNTKK